MVLRTIELWVQAADPPNRFGPGREEVVDVVLSSDSFEVEGWLESGEAKAPTTINDGFIGIHRHHRRIIKSGSDPPKGIRREDVVMVHEYDGFTSNQIQRRIGS